MNGPAVAGHEGRVATAWFTGAEDRPRVLLQIGELGAAPSPPRVLDEDGPIGRPDLAFLDDGTLLVSWVGRSDDAAVLRVQALPADASAQPAQEVAVLEGSRGNGFPRLSARGQEAWLAWTEPGEPSRVRCVRIVRCLDAH